MTSRLIALADAESSVRERMAVSRANLAEVREAARMRSGSSPSLTKHAREIVSVAPNVTLLAALLIGLLVIGPRTIVSIVVRNGLAAWIAKNIRRVAGR